MIVVDGSRAGRPSDAELAALEGGDTIQWIEMPGASVFQLRFAAYKRARGEVVAITEDHCLVEENWVERVLAAHARHPNAGAIGGAVLNGTTSKLIDWAGFVLTQAPFMPPLANGTTDRISGPANVSYKRRVLERLRGDAELGVIEWLELPAALAGEELADDDTIRVLHHQSPGFWGMSRAEYDNGRTIAGYRRREMGRGDWLRIISSPVLPMYRSIRTWRIASRKQMPFGVLVRSAPAHVWLQYCANAGELMGYARGPGDSPTRLY